MRELFPLTVLITQQVINNADIHSRNLCIGARALRAAIKNVTKKLPTHVKWGNSLGQWHDIYLTSVDENDKPMKMMSLRKPTTVTFKLRYP